MSGDAIETDDGQKSERPSGAALNPTWSNSVYIIRWRPDDLSTKTWPFRLGIRAFSQGWSVPEHYW